MLATAAFLLAMIVIVGVLAALAWSSVLAGDVWGAWSYGGIALLVIILTLRKL